MIFFLVLFAGIQLYFFNDVRKKRAVFKGLFEEGESGYKVKSVSSPKGENILQIDGFNDSVSDFGTLVGEINDYIAKSKGTTEFSVIQNKTERLIEMRYDDSTARISFPVYCGLMGTFWGVFLGIVSFINVIGDGGVNDSAIKGLLEGVVISMGTSFMGLLLTTISNYLSSDAKRKVDVDKNEFYDFIQTQLMPSLDVSMVAALNKLHDTVTMFEPSFNRVIDRFQTTFQDCTAAFGEQFTNNVKVVSNAVAVMGKNMDKINENIQLQRQLISTLKGRTIVNGLEAFVEATNHFTELTASLNKFEEARRMMLRATEEVINMQKQYTESLEIPKELVIKVNSILDRITTFEASINNLGESISQTQLIGNDTINLINEQLNGIKRKGGIADRYLTIADGKLKDLYERQVSVIGAMNKNYEQAIKGHIQGFDRLIEDSTNEFKQRHEDFKKAIDEKFNIAEVHDDFSNLKRLNDISQQLNKLNDLERAFTKYQASLNEVKGELEDIKKIAKSANGGGAEGGFLGGLFRRNKDEKK